MKVHHAFLGAALLFGMAPLAQAFDPPATFDEIESTELTRLDVWTVAAIGRADGALPNTLWQGSDSARLAELFDRLPASFDSPVAFRLARRALASSGIAPSGETQPDAARKRFSALGRIGLADDISVMSGGAGEALKDPQIAQFAAQAELARANVPEACAKGRQAEGEQPAFLLRLRAYCAAASGETAAADLALEIARNANADDAWFRSVINAMASRPARPPVARFDNSLNASVSIAANLTPPANPLRNASSLALLSVARAQTAPPALRAQAAALAFRRGLMAPREARAAILAALEAQAENMPPLALAIRQAEQSRGSLETATAIASLMRPNVAYADFAAAARLFHDDIAALETAPNAAGALAFARAAVASGDQRLAARLLESAGLAEVSATALAPLETARAIATPQTAEAAALIVQRRVENVGGGAASLRALSRDLTILAALGYPLDAAAQAHLETRPPQGGARADAALLTALESAAGDGAIGETALLVAIIAAPGAHTLDAAAQTAIIRALLAVNLDADARAFAVEAMIGAAS